VIGERRVSNERELAGGLPPTPGYRYAEAVGDVLFVSGQVPHDSGGEIVAPNDAGRQAEQCLANLSTLLGVHGCLPRHVRQLRVYVVGDRGALGDAWAAVSRWFGDVPPATLLGVSALGHAGQVVEIDASVVRD
jgi:enamine deaminase RidA (YjgF/YER057c/UK114 family)